MNAVELSLVLPCRNQGDHLAPLLPAYHLALSSLSLPFELIVVPNACTDNTPEIVSAFASAHPNVKVVDNPRGGWGLSVRLGLAAATGSILGYTNTARTDPAVIPDFMRRYLTHAPCLVKARRWGRAAPIRSLGSVLYNLEARILFRIAVGDVNGTPKLFPAGFYRDIPAREDGDLLDLEILAWARRRALRVVEIPLQGFQRHGGKSSTNLRSARKMYLGALRLWWHMRHF